jgi:signal transduction histidine kinase/ligand-binding sensor domain-containing protein
MENGLPQNTVQAMAQTKDGFLWLGTEVGLVRFDGVSFQVFDKNTPLGAQGPGLPGNDVRCLLAAKDGALWIGTSEGLARWKDGVATVFTTKEGLPGINIRALVESGGDGVWVSTDDGLARQKGAEFLSVEFADYALPAGVPNYLIEQGTGLWIGTAGTVGMAPHGSWEQVSLGVDTPPPFPRPGVVFEQGIAGGGIAAASNSLLVVTKAGQSEEQLSVGKQIPGSKIQALFADREGAIWIGSNGGLAKWFGGKVQLFPVTDPLARASVLSIMEDREGDIWVGTEADGLHILRDQRFRTMGAREGLSSDATTTVVEDAAGTLWVGTSGAGLNAIKGGAIQHYGVKEGLPSDVILSLAAGTKGELWVGTPDGLGLLRGGGKRIEAFTSADGLPDDFVRSLLADGDGALWIGTRRGLTHWLNPQSPIAAARMETYTQANGLGSDLVGAMTRDAKGDLWVATLAGLSKIEKPDGLHSGKVENFTTANGLTSNVVTALLARKDGTLLIGTQDHGWSAWDGKQFKAAAGSGLERTTIHAILDEGSRNGATPDGAMPQENHLWFATGNGVARCDCDRSGGCTHWLEFGPADGLRSRETAINSHPSAWRGRDGHLWFATPKGLVDVDPAHFHVNDVAPPVALERFAVDDVAMAASGAAIEIPAGHVHFEFDYAALSFVAPQKVRYRYMLEGFDKQWTEAGGRRTAYYTNIPAGSYVFRVQAANNDGLWNMAGAELKFELRPHFYQTLWFYGLVGLGLAGMVWLVLRWREQRAAREFQAVLGERNRIAREIHDTLAQGYVGISVQLEVLAQLLHLNKTEAATKHLDLTRGYVREGLDEARQSIWALRSQDAGETTLPVKMRRVVEGAGGNGLEASFSLYGAYRPLSPGTEQEILRVAQEALENVRKHAHAAHVFVQLDYRPMEIALEVRDDGRGFRAEGEVAPPPGHYGLTGMKERAAVIGGTLEVTSEPGVGTTVRLRTAAAKAMGND